MRAVGGACDGYTRKTDFPLAEPRGSSRGSGKERVVQRGHTKQDEGRRNGDDVVRIMAVLPLIWKTQRHNLYWLASI
jgi:hypothetical protein